MMRYDLHTHSSHSDGVLTPTALVRLAREQGVDSLALTDHDTVSGLHEAERASRDVGLQLVNGVEISCSWNRQVVHIVGLNIDPRCPQLARGLEANIDIRRERADKMFSKLEKRGIHLRDKVMGESGGRAPTRTHFARVMVHGGMVKDMGQAFRRYLSNGKPGYVSASWSSLEDAVSWINVAGGTAVLAHPLAYRMTQSKLRRLLRDFSDVGGKGMEVVSGNTDSIKVAKLAVLADEFQLMASLGSDFHSPEQRWAMVGSCPGLPPALTPVWYSWN